MKQTFEDIRNNGLLLYEYVRGSHAYGLAIEGKSDIDTGGVYIAPKTAIYGLREKYKEQIADAKNDNVWYEIGRYLELLCNANPTMLESLFVPDSCVRYIHPAFKIIRDNRDMFITKMCFKSFAGYASSQIKKSRGLNKKITDPIKERKTPVDFCYTFNDKQGSMPMKKWLGVHGLKQIYCGLVHIPNMNQIYGVYYDWGQHIHMEWKNANEFVDYVLHSDDHKFLDSFERFNHVDLRHKEKLDLFGFYNDIKPKGFHGIEKEDGSSCEIHRNSVPEDDRAIIHMSYNENGFTSHCRKYKETKDWEKNRNPVRFQENLEKEFDRKNMMHSVRLLRMGIEIAKTGKVNVDRHDIDREELLNIRLGNTTYDELIKYLEEKELEMNEIFEKSTLPKSVDHDKVNELLLKIRFAFYENTLK